MTGISYDDTGYLEHVQVLADQKAGQYSETTTVDTTSPKTGYTAYAIRHDGTTASAKAATPKSVTTHWNT